MSFIIMAPRNIDDLLVVESLPVPNVTSVDNVRPLIIKISEEESIAIMDKKKAHSLFEVMVIQTASVIKEGIDELSNAEFRLFTHLMKVFGSFISDQNYIDMFELQGCLPRISFNYDPLTHDRESLQDIKRFHAHMFLISPEQQRYIANHKRKFVETCDLYQKRRLVDPFSFIAEQILLDLHQTKKVLVPDTMALVQSSFEEKVASGQPLGLNINFLNGWESIGDEAFNSYLLSIHLAIKQATNEIYFAFTGNKVKDVRNERYSLLDRVTIEHNLNQLTWLSRISREALLQIAGKLKPFPRKLVTSPNLHSKLINHHVIANGSAFTVSISSDQCIGDQGKYPVSMNISVRLFSDIGGAGLFGCRNVSSIYLNRRDGFYSDLQMTKRHKFQEAFLNVVKENIDYPTEIWTEERIIQLFTHSKK